MGTRVDFYVLGHGGEQDRLRAACRIMEKAWQQGHMVWLTAESERQAEQLDQLLWTFKQDSFVPHERGTEGALADCAVRIVAPSEAPDGGVHVNVATSPLPMPLVAERVVEIIPADTDGRAAGRERFRAYRAHGYDINTHDI